MVRGKSIEYTDKAINDYLECQINGEDEYSQLKGSILIEELAKEITRNGEIEYSITHKQLIYSTCLSRQAKVWALFITSSLIPPKHLSGISLEKAQSIYYILLFTISY